MVLGREGRNVLLDGVGVLDLRIGDVGIQLGLPISKGTLQQFGFEIRQGSLVLGLTDLVDQDHSVVHAQLGLQRHGLDVLEDALGVDQPRQILGGQLGEVLVLLLDVHHPREIEDLGDVLHLLALQMGYDSQSLRLNVADVLHQPLGSLRLKAASRQRERQPIEHLQLVLVASNHPGEKAGVLATDDDGGEDEAFELAVRE